MTNSKEELHGTITARAELDRAFARLIIEDVSAVMAKNLSTLLQMMEKQHLEAMAVTEDTATTVKKLLTDISALGDRLAVLETRMDDSQVDRQSIHDELAALRKELRSYVAGSKRDEFARRLSALEARDDDRR